jgi:outer membrane protein
MTNDECLMKNRSRINHAVARHWSLVIGHWSFQRARLLAFVFAAAFVARAAPLQLDDAIRLALEHNQRVKVSAFSRDIARANVLAAYGAFDPALTFNRSYSETNLPVSVSPLVTQLTQTDDYSLSLDGAMPWGLTYSLGATANNQRGTFNRFTDSYITFGGVSVTQPLLRGFGFGANLASLRIARANRGISDWQHRQTVIDIVTGVILTYNNLVQARDNLRIARLSRELAAQLLDQNEKRNRVGALSDADVIQARARVADREESILFAERSARDVENRLRELIGETVYSNTAPELDLAPLVPAAEIAVNAGEDLKRAYDLRPDYQAARLGISIQRANTAAAQNQLLPRVDFVGSYGYNGIDRDFAASRAQVRNEDARAYSAGVVVRVPLTFAEGRGRARAAKLGLRQSEADLQRLEQDIAVSVAAAAGQLDTTRQRVSVTRTALDLAKQALDAEEKRLKAGASSTFLVLQLQEQRSAVENGYYAALADQRRAIASYEHELGTTLESHHLTLE